MAIRIRHIAACTPVFLVAGIGMLAHPAEVAATAGIAASFVGPLTAMSAYSADPFRGNTARLGVATAVLVGVGGAVVAGLAALLGGVAVPVAGLLLVAGAMWVWRRDYPAPVRAYLWPDAPIVTASGAPTAAGLPVETGAVSTVDLCETWQHTGWLLRALPSTSPDRSVVVDARRRLLDEFERRDPAGFHRWMQDEPDTRSDPGQYLHTDR